MHLNVGFDMMNTEISKIMLKGTLITYNWNLYSGMIRYYYFSEFVHTGNEVSVKKHPLNFTDSNDMTAYCLTLTKDSGWFSEDWNE